MSSGSGSLPGNMGSWDVPDQLWESAQPHQIWTPGVFGGLNIAQDIFLQAH